ncbi:hypothetical protein QUF99_08200 [Bacillus sp. DX4.1]|uniref:hypothetical protein n=1 Tax=Bacillus sp. DX4.1 TaxID=3055867 RepID=UPI0025A079FA|nr:hypothetical protein [Bacillus sp. DX4.1]MDM5187308.1 hypothetical protein [Bacillus sp. DX4.1]
MITKPSTYPKQEISMIPLRKIKPLYIPHITKVFYTRMNNIFSHLGIFDLLLPVEKHPQKDEYFLVGKYDLYYFMINHTNLNEAPCIIEEFTGKTTQSLKILRRLHNKGDSNKTSKQNILSKLSNRNLPLSKIIKMTGFIKQDLKDYHYNSVVPRKYISDHTTETTLNWIANLTLDATVKEFLYERAGLPQKNQDRLTDEKRKFLNHFFRNSKRFEQLSAPKQINVLTYAMNFKGVVISHLQKQIDSYLN